MSGFLTVSANLSMGNNIITNVGSGISATDTINKSYVDALPIKMAVYVASTADLNTISQLNGSYTYNATGGTSGTGRITATLSTSNQLVLDGQTLTSTNNNARILLKDQVNDTNSGGNPAGSSNGIWTLTISGTSLTLNRATDFNTNLNITPGSQIFVQNGTSNGTTEWTLTTSSVPSVGSTALSFSNMFSTFTDTSTYFQNNVDNTKQLQFSLSGITTGTTRTLTIPDISDTIVTLTASQTLTNKTLTTPVIATINNTGTLTLPTSTDTLVGRGTTDILTNKTLTAPVISTIVNTGTLTLPTSSDTLVGRATTDTLTNKTLTAPVISTIINTGTLTLPTSNDTLVGRGTTDTLTNKTFGDSLNMGSNKIVSLAIPTSASDAATKGYVDGVAQGLSIKNPVVAASTGDLFALTLTTFVTSQSYNNTDGIAGTGQITGTLNSTPGGTLSIDGVNFTSAENDARILLKNQTDATSNGIWTITISGNNYTLDRAVDFSTTVDVVSGSFTFVQQGTINDNSGWVLTTNFVPVVGTTSLNFVQFSGAGQILAGNGISISGNTVSTNILTNGGLIYNGTSLQVDVGASSITGILPISHGGTNASSFSNGDYFVQTNSGNNALTTTLAIPSSAVVGISDTQTLTNKTLTTPIISSISNTGTLTLPTSTDTLVGRTTTDTLTNKTLTAPVIATIVNTGTLTLPTSSDTLVGRATTDTLTNKTLIDNSTTFQNNSAPTKQFQFDSASITAGQTRIITIPDLSDTLVTLSATQILTNKTLDDITNTIAADILHSATTSISISGAAAPLSGQVLTALSGTSASWQALVPTIFVADANNNISVGDADLQDTAVLNSTTVGAGAGSLQVSGAENNTLVGYNAGNSLTTGTQNTIIGSGASTSTNTVGSVAVGYNTFITGTNGITIGNGTSVTSANGIAMGENATSRIASTFNTTSAFISQKSNGTSGNLNAKQMGQFSSPGVWFGSTDISANTTGATTLTVPSGATFFPTMAYAIINTTGDIGTVTFTLTDGGSNTYISSGVLNTATKHNAASFLISIAVGTSTLVVNVTGAGGNTTFRLFVQGILVEDD